MCGIVGQFGQPLVPGSLTELARHIARRGPDGHAEWIDRDAGIGFAHRRLAIVDLSEAGTQPMNSASGRYVICLNGEIYNHQEIRRIVEEAAPERRGHWRGHSDTETFLAAVEEFGLGKSLEISRGMFAFGLWDRHEQLLTLVRDRFGEKPLYYGWAGDTFLFASDLAAIRAHPAFRPDISTDAVTAYLRTNYVPAPLSIFKRVFKLPPASVLTLSAEDVAQPREIPFGLTDIPASPRGAFAHYWSYADVLRQGSERRFKDDQEAVDAIETALQQVVQMQCQADVSVGCMLSGGIDSSLITALASHYGGPRPRTFSIGFNESEFDEAVHAKAVARHLSTDHTELYVRPEDVIDLIPQLPRYYTEPFADSSQLPTYLVCQLARQSVTVALSGDAGDELFCGYNRHKWTAEIWPKIEKFPPPLRRAGGELIDVMPDSFWRMASKMPGPLNIPSLSFKMRKISKILRNADNVESLYAHLLDEWGEIGSDRKGQLAAFAYRPGDELSDVRKLMYWDSMTYLPDDILCKVDRAAMANSLETRVPFLDHHVAGLAAALPDDMLIRDGKTKWLLRQILYKYVPQKLIDRPKAGFGIPVGQWLRGPLREWAETLMDVKSLPDVEGLDVSAIRLRWEEHLSGRRDWSSSLWGILMFQAFKADLDTRP